MTIKKGLMVNTNPTFRCESVFMNFG